MGCRDQLKSASYGITADLKSDSKDGYYVNRNIYMKNRTPENLEKANEEQFKLFTEHQKRLNGARVAGASEEQIWEMLNARRKPTPSNPKGARYISKKWADQLFSKKFIPMNEKEGMSKPKKQSYAPKKRKKSRSSGLNE